jgi:ubiquitin-conjugating enzyme E2 J2
VCICTYVYIYIYIFVLLFYFQEIIDIMKQIEESSRSDISASQISSNITKSSKSLKDVVHNPELHNQGFLSSTLTNLFVIVGFAAFAYTVKYVLRSIVEW